MLEPLKLTPEYGKNYPTAPKIFFNIHAIVIRVFTAIEKGYVWVLRKFACPEHNIDRIMKVCTIPKKCVHLLFDVCAIWINHIKIDAIVYLRPLWSCLNKLFLSFLRPFLTPIAYGIISVGLMLVPLKEKLSTRLDVVEYRIGRVQELNSRASAIVELRTKWRAGSFSKDDLERFNALEDEIVSASQGITVQHLHFL